MDRKMASILEGLFGGLFLFAFILWISLSLYPALLIAESLGSSLLVVIFLNPYFIFSIIFVILAIIFQNMKESISP